MSEFLYIAAAVFFGTALVLMGLWVIIRFAPRGGASRDVARNDLANMMILLQTMRDILRQQKELAREFNESLDKKVALIRKLDNAVREQNERIKKRQQEFEARLADTESQLNSVTLQARFLSQREEDAGEEEDAALGEVERMREKGAAELAVPPREEGESKLRPGAGNASDKPERDFPVLQLIVTPEESTPTGEDLIDNWPRKAEGNGPRRTAERKKPELKPLAGAVSSDTADSADTVRDAFRALLNLDADEEAETGHEATTSARGNNGAGQLSPMHRRVYEYSDAGMTVAQIARELGIGKGEVRLVLSLRKDKELNRGRS